MALLGVSPVFEHVPVESIIKEWQATYYEVLGASDKAGHCTPFLEFLLRALRDALDEFLTALRPEPETQERRLSVARVEFGNSWFTRKDYLTLHKALATATASRDLRAVVDTKELERRGEKALTEYRFRKRRRPALPVP